MFNNHKKFHTQLNWEPFAMFLLALVSIVATVFLITAIIVTGYKKITLFREELEASRIINKQYNILFSMELNLNENIVTKKQMDERKKIYDAAEREIQRKALLKAETEISKEICPVGTYVFLKDMHRAVRVKALSGYQAATYEDIYFLTIDTDSYYTLSMHEYNLFKREEERNGKTER